MKFHTVLNTATSAIAVGAAFLAMPAFAQSTGSIDFDNDAIVVTGARASDVAGVELPDSSKAKQVVTQELISRGTPGQSVGESINLIPGVSFTNNDAYGSSGGNLMIRGFDDTRISMTFDGLPLNDTGGYSLYTNQQLDPELIEQVNVNLGTTDVDSPTAAASGSTVNYRSINPDEEFGARMVGTVGENDKMRIFAMINTGNLNDSGTRAWFAASKDTYTPLWGHFGKIDKTQVNGKIYQPLGDNGDFISVAGHYNWNRNNNASDWALRDDVAFTAGGIPLNKDERDAYRVTPCQRAEGVYGVADTYSSCGTSYEYGYNPSNTGNIRINSRFTLSDSLVLTVDPSFQVTSANGGSGYVRAYEYAYNDAVLGSHPTSSVVSGYITDGSYANAYFGGVDLNGDGDTMDTVNLAGPSQTRTQRIGVIASLRYDLNDSNRFRVAYSYDRGRHRQTGELGLLNDDGTRAHYFNMDDALTDVNGNILQKRDRLSYAILHQFSGEYSGDFANDTLHLNAGLRVPFFRRNLTNNCITSTSSGTVSCFTTDTADQAAYAAEHPTHGAPDHRVFNYSRVLPTAGLTFNVTPEASIYANYSMGLQVPGTDALYQSFYYAPGEPGAKSPNPETSNNFDLGIRYRSGMIQANLGGWYTIFADRLSSSYDPTSQITTYTNLGTVDRYGIDGTFAVQPDSHFTAYVFGSYLWSKIRDDVQTSATGYAETKGNMEGGVPSYTFGGRVQGNVGPLSVGVEAKRTGSRYYNSLNTPVYSRSGDQIWGSKVPAYTVVNLDARLDMSFVGMGDKTFVQLNVANLFDEFYYGSFDDAGVSDTATSYTYIGAGRTVSASINFQF
ncbi:TonB-dependent receptor [Novosphingobium profundi]|uniref:TonB-dependent receptor n=1 Tax=Novosphingobium profundi TaxID=1774954 RepID=UPI001BDA42EC|nr:TonB-dependent receptor [Novosphingobium profundi]MBT0666805.1 TonB-dependent receptor [Novosphingobium profundi]